MSGRRARRERAEHQLPNYFDDVLRLGQALGRGSVGFVTVAHDEWCSLLRGVGPCDCGPEVRLLYYEPPKPSAN